MEIEVKAKKKCSVCQDEVQDFIHLSCLLLDESAKEKDYCNQHQLTCVDAQSAFLTFAMLMERNPERSTSAQLQWQDITIVSHPYQKQALNMLGLALKQDADALNLIEAFWQQVTWLTDDDCFPSTVRVQYKGADVCRIINLYSWPVLDTYKYKDSRWQKLMC